MGETVTQTNGQQATQQLTAPNENVPAITNENDESSANQDSGFIDSASKKVELDLEGAPFLVEEQEEEEKPKPQEEKKSEEDEQAELERLAKAKKKKIIILGLAGLLVVILSVAGYFFLFSTPEEVIPPTIIIIPSETEATVDSSLEIKLDPFWIELVNKEGKKQFLVGSFILQLSNTAGKTETLRNMKIVRDAVYYYFVNSDYEFLSQHQNIGQIKRGMIDLLNQYIIGGEVEDIYFDSFLFK